MSEKTFTEDESIKSLADSIIEESKLDYLNNVRIKYLIVDPCISKTCAAKCIKSNKEVEFFSDSDYIIEVSQNVWDKVDDTMRKYLIKHQLLHILLVPNKSGIIKFKIVKHDVSDFSTTINEFGSDISKNLKVITSSINELDTIDNIEV